jgi:hypothetical protein
VGAGSCRLCCRGGVVLVVPTPFPTLGTLVTLAGRNRPVSGQPVQPGRPGQEQGRLRGQPGRVFGQPPTGGHLATSPLPGLLRQRPPRVLRAPLRRGGGRKRWPGRPSRFPCLLARPSPALVRSISLARSCSATQPKIATRSGGTGPEVSSQPSWTDMTGRLAAPTPGPSRLAPVRERWRRSRAPKIGHNGGRQTASSPSPLAIELLHACSTAEVDSGAGEGSQGTQVEADKVR